MWQETATTATNELGGSDSLGGETLHQDVILGGSY